METFNFYKNNVNKYTVILTVNGKKKLQSQSFHTTVFIQRKSTNMQMIEKITPF